MAVELIPGARSAGGRSCAFCGARRRRVLLLATAALLASWVGGRADELPVIRNNYGGAGLIDMPSARMAPDGELDFSAVYFHSIQRYNLSFQALPWLEASLRYSGLANFQPGYPIYYDRSFAVKARLWNEGDILPSLAIGLNDIVGTGIYGGEYVVASKQFGAVDATLGMGWGRLASRPAVRNPLGLIIPSFNDRFIQTIDVGQFSPRAYFRGRNVGLFGGLQWQTPLDGLSLLAEYSSDAYTQEDASGTFHPKNPFNVGAAYAVNDNVSLAVNWLYGSSLAGNVVFHTDTTRPLYPGKVGIEPPEVHVRSTAEQQQALAYLIQRDAQGRRNTRRELARDRDTLVDKLWMAGFADASVKGRTLVLTARKQPSPSQCAALADLSASYGDNLTSVAITLPGQPTLHCQVPRRVQAMRIGTDSELVNLAALPDTLDTIDASRPVLDAPHALRAIRADGAKQGLTILAVSLDGGEARVYYVNRHYFAEHEAVERLTRILMADSPPDIERFRFIGMEAGVPQRQFTIMRSTQERLYNQEGHLRILGDAGEMAPAPMNNPVLALADRHAFPRFNWAIYPQLRQQFFDPQNPLGLQLVGVLGANLEVAEGLALEGGVEGTVFQNFTYRDSDSLLPHVRTDYIKYLRAREGITYLQASYITRLAPTVYFSVRGGILEPMFSGAGGQLLWRPDGQRWALGVDAYEVWQRNFDRLFGLQPYHVFTGHVSLYYASPWYNLDFTVRAGQYLAGDRGITFELSRRFSTGFEIGLFATKTNVSARQFGEGSFDKGIILRMPLEWLAPVFSQASLNFDLRPTQRDGGQRLLGDDFLYAQTQRLSQPEILRQEDDTE